MSELWTHTLSVSEVSVRLGVSVDTVRRLCKSGDLPALKFGSPAGYRVPEPALAEWVKARAAGGTAGGFGRSSRSQAARRGAAKRHRRNAA